MDMIGTIGAWVTANESLLSGLAAMVVLLGVILTPFGKFVSGLRAKRAAPAAAAPAVLPELKNPAGTSPQPAPEAEKPAKPDNTQSPVIAVLAFDNQSSDPDLQFFSEGVSDDIIQILSRGTSLRLIARTSSFQFRGERKAEAPAALGCTHILDGAVRRAAGRVRVSAHLMDARSGMTLWSERFDRDLADIFGVQDEIAAQIGLKLNHTFPARQGFEPPPELYDLYLRSMLKSYSPDELRQSIGRLEEVTRQAPAYGAAWGRLAYQRTFLHFYMPYAARPAVLERIQVEVDTALSLDEGNVDAISGRIFSLPPYGRFAEFHTLLERLRALPRSGDGYRYVGWMLRHLGFVNEALKESEAAWLLDPLDPMSANLVALARMAAGEVDRAIPVFEDLVRRVPDMSFALSSLLRALAFKGDWDGVDRLLALANERQLREFEEGLHFIRAKRQGTGDIVDAWTTRVRDRVTRTGTIDLSAMVYTAHLGRVDEAYALIEAYRLGPTGGSEDILGPDAYRPAILFQAGMPELRQDPRFARLCGRLGLARFWTESGRWPDCVDELPYDLRASCRTTMDLAESWVYPKASQ